MKKKLMCLIIFCFICLNISACRETQIQYQNGVYIPPFISKNEFRDFNYIKVLDDYQSIYSISYLNADNTKTLYLFSSPIGYESDGKINYINNQIEPIENETLISNGYNYTNAQNDITTMFPQNLNSNPIQLLTSEIGIKFSPFINSDNAKFNRNNNTIEYKLEDQQLSITPTALGVNNKITGKDLLDEYSFSFEIAQKYTIDTSIAEYMLIKEAEDYNVPKKLDTD